MTTPIFSMLNIAELTFAVFGAAGRSSRSGLDWTLFAWIGGGVVGVIIFVTLIVVLVKRRGGNAAYSHVGLFKQLCHVHGLDRKSQKLLRRVADYFRMPQPARIFTEPHWLNPEKLGGLGFADKDVIDNLRKKIFDISLKTKSGDTPQS